MVNIDHEVKIHSSMKQLYQALTSLEGLKAWYSPHITVSAEGILTVNATDKPIFKWKITPTKSEQSVIWECIAGPGNSVGSQAVFTLSETDKNRTLLEFAHDSWPDQEGNYRKCNTLWGILLHHLKMYAETNQANPAFL